MTYRNDCWSSVAVGQRVCRAASPLCRLVFFLTLLFAGLGFSTSAYAQAVITWDDRGDTFVSAYDLTNSRNVPYGSSVEVGTLVEFNIAVFAGVTLGGPPSGCPVSHYSPADTWRGTITETCHLAFSLPRISVQPPDSTEAVVGQSYSGAIMAWGGSSPYTYTLESGSLPSGITLASDGTVSGIPGEGGSFPVTVRATNEYGHYNTGSFTLTVSGSTAAPEITSISPNTGPAEGGTSVTISGTNFTGATAVNFGGEPVFSFVVDSATQITANTSPHAQGPVDVEVVAPGGSVTAPGAFTYDAPVELFLSIDDVTVVEGDSGATPATFTIQLNQPLPQFRSVTFDVATADGTAIAGIDYQAVSSPGLSMGQSNTALSFTVPVNGDTLAEPDKSFFVNITNVTGATVARAQGVGTIQDDDAAGPTITSISPNAGAPGTIVTITGSGLTGASSVHFDGVVSIAVTPVDDNTVLAEVPAHPGGVVDVEVYADAGVATAAAAFTIDNSRPTANPVSATVAYGSSNNPITLNITGVPASSVAVGTAPANGTATATGMSITYTPAPGYAGTDSFTYTATNAGGTSSPATVTITVSPPMIAYAPTNPPAGVVGVPYSQSIAGGASGGASPYTYAQPSGTMVPGLTLAADGTLNGTPTTAGTFTFRVVATDSSSGAGPFSSPPADVSVTIGQDAPTITGISPDTGPMAGGTSVTITGTDLTGATAVTFGAVPAAIDTVTATQITAVTPAGSAGAADVMVTTPGGSATLNDGFTYT
ncbi:IPT/TIG domain-containing protein, partial [Aquamicrobium sp. LC103]|uniref:IPT/TIG domain-containing protein n=1 Tax=Aquamicrobium sp. LC103 TaxID=1120658 RepID=UPI00148548D2